MKCIYCQSEMVLEYSGTINSQEDSYVVIYKCKSCGAEYQYDDSKGSYWNTKVEIRQCRFCKYFKPHVGGYYGGVDMCYQFTSTNSIYCGMSETDSCSKFKLCSQIKKIIGGYQL